MRSIQPGRPDAAEAGYRVGYADASHFNRDYNQPALAFVAISPAKRCEMIWRASATNSPTI